MFKNLFANMQKVGKALMLPVSVMPVAGILLGVGAADFSWLPSIVSTIMMNAGDAVFGHMGLLFAVGVAWASQTTTVLQVWLLSLVTTS